MRIHISVKPQGVHGFHYRHSLGDARMIHNVRMKIFRSVAVVVMLAVLHGVGSLCLLLLVAPHWASSGDDKIYSLPVLGVLLLKILWFPYLIVAQASWWPGSSRLLNLALYCANSLLWAIVIYWIGVTLLKRARFRRNGLP